MTGGKEGWYSSYSTPESASWEHNHDDSSTGSSSSMTNRSSKARAGSGGRRSGAQSASLDIPKFKPASSSSSSGGGIGSSSSSKRRGVLATTMVCACIGTFFAFSSQGSSTNIFGGDSRSLRATSRMLQAAEEYNTAVNSRGGDLEPEEIVAFLAKYGLEMKDLEILAQLKGVKPRTEEEEEETSSSSSSGGGQTDEMPSMGMEPPSSMTEGFASSSQVGSMEQEQPKESSSYSMEQPKESSYSQEQPMSQMGMQQQPSSSSQFQSQPQMGMMESQQQQGGFMQMQQQGQNGYMQQQPSMYQQGQQMQQMQPYDQNSQMGTMQQGFPQQASTFTSGGFQGGVLNGGGYEPQQQQQMGTEPSQQQQSSGGFGSFESSSSEAPAAAEGTAPSSSSSAPSGGGDLSTLSNFKDSWDPWEKSDVPIFFHIPKAGGSTVKDVIGTCHRFVMATEYGVTDGHDADTEIAVVYPAGGPPGTDRSPFVNVDTTTVAGIERAASMGFADAGLADAVVTPFIYEANNLFTPTARGRLFTVFRHPIERAISMFYYIQVADWEPTYSPDLKDWTIEQYAESDKIENNWMTRQLSGQLAGELNDDNLAVAKEVIRSKFLVGLMNRMDETMTRFEKFFRWKFKVNPPNQEACREKLMHGGSNANSKGPKKDKPKEGDAAWEKLMWQNQYDMQLYGYIEQLFDMQEEFVRGVPDDYRNVDATCCKCDPPTFPPEGFECPKAVLN